MAEGSGSLHLDWPLDDAAGQELLLDPMSSRLPLVFQEREVLPHFVEHLSCPDEAAPFVFRNHRRFVREWQNPSGSHGHPRLFRKAPGSQTSPPLRGPDRWCCEESAANVRPT